MKNRSIGLKLTLILVCISLAGMIITAGFNYFLMRANIYSETVDKYQRTTEYQAQTINNWLTSKKAIVNSWGGDISAANNLDMIEPSSMAQASLDPELISVYCGFSNDLGIFSDNEPDFATWKATQRGWYKSAMAANKKIVVTSPYQDALTNKVVITVTKSIGQVAGLDTAAAIDVDIKTILDIVDNIDAAGGYAFLTDDAGNLVVHPEYGPKGENMQLIGSIENYRDLKPGGDPVQITDYDGSSKFIFSSVITESNWVLYLALPEHVIFDKINQSLFSLILIVVLVAAVAIVTLFITRKLIVKPIEALSLVIDDVCNTGFLFHPPETVDSIMKFADKDNEISRSIKGFAKMMFRLRELSSHLETIASGDLTQDITLLGNKDSIGTSLKEMNDKLNDMFGEISNAANIVAAGSSQIASDVQSMAHGAVQQASEISVLTTSVDSVSDKTKENTILAETSANLAISIRDNAQTGSQQMDRMTKAVRDINEASTAIGKVIKVIDDIAFQTNILALNAAVEAARAGQHGKGFAVVAEEVRNLAAKSAVAAKDTGTLIANSIEKAELGARIAEETASSLKEIVEGINESSRVVAEIASSSEEQNAAIAKISTGINQVAGVIQQNTATAEEGASASSEMRMQSERLQILVSKFKLKKPVVNPQVHNDRLSLPSLPVHDEFHDNNSSYGKY